MTAYGTGLFFSSFVLLLYGRSWEDVGVGVGVGNIGRKPENIGANEARRGAQTTYLGAAEQALPYRYKTNGIREASEYSR